MLRFRCPLCAEIFELPESLGGKAGLCPHCHARVRVPEAPPAPTPQFRPTSEPPPANRRPRRVEETARETMTAEEPRRLLREPDEPIVPRSRRAADYHHRPSRDDDEDRPSRVDDYDRPRRRRERPRRRRQPGDAAGKSARTGMLVGGIIAGVVVLVTCAASLILPPVALAVVGFGFVLAMIGNIWFLAVAFGDDAIQGLLCMFLPFYALYYLIANFEEEKMPFFTHLAGTLIVMFGMCAGFMGLALHGGEGFGP